MVVNEYYNYNKVKYFHRNDATRFPVVEHFDVMIKNK